MALIPIKPLSEALPLTLPDGRRLPPTSVLWQGIHVCVAAESDDGDRWLQDLPIGHSAHWPLTINQTRGRASGIGREVAWLAEPLMNSLQRPSTKPVRLVRERFKECGEVTILNCLDFMYGHCLLKLLNASRHLAQAEGRGLVILLPASLRWLVPDGVAEVWSVELPLSELAHFHTDLNAQIERACDRFERVALSEAYSHPSRFRIQDYAGVAPHAFEDPAERVAFVWRDDRPWLAGLTDLALRRCGLTRLSPNRQAARVLAFFTRLRRIRPEVECRVVGLGTKGRFPDWISDDRVAGFTREEERLTARLCSESRVVVGVHGSNMLLPSGLAGMSLDLMPKGKWDCIAMDTLFEEPDPRLAVFRHRFVPVGTGPDLAASIVASMLKQCREVRGLFLEDKSRLALHGSA